MSYDALQVPLKESPCKVVYVCRNVKDVLVSHWHFSKSHKGVYRVAWEENKVTESLDPLFESYRSGVILFSPFWDQVLSYWRGSLEDPKHVLFMRYEELKAEPHAQVNRLAEFLECPFTEEEEESGMVNKTGKRWMGVDMKSFYRRGEVGDSKNYLTHEMETKLDMIIEEKLKGSGLKL